MLLSEKTSDDEDETHQDQLFLWNMRTGAFLFLPTVFCFM